MSNKWIIVILLVTSAIVHFAFFGHPAETVFDEVHFGKFISGYYTGQYYFDIHPPLGKLIIAGFAKFFDFEPEYSFTNIGDKFQDNKYLSLRFLPALAGTLLPLVIYLIVLELGMSRMAALAGGLLVIFDNALLTQSRLILLDSFLLLFGFSSLLFYFKYTKNRILNTKYLILTAVLGGLAMSIKWTGLSFIALPLLIEVTRCTIKLSYDNFIVHLKRIVFLLAIPAVLYFSVFAVHFALLPNPGPGDAFMKPNFRQHRLVKNIWDLNLEMYKSNQRLGATHPYGSAWNTWPFMTRPIFYWVKDHSRIYFVGNPIIWWAGTASILCLIFSILYLGFKKFNTTHKTSNIVYILLGGYFLNILPFIEIKRVMFLYHYLTASIFALLTLVYLIDKNSSTSFNFIQDKSLTARKNAKIYFGILVTAAFAAFVFFAPLNYGLPLSDKMYEWTVWFASWR